MSDLKWSGWEIKGPLLVSPRRVRLQPRELKLMRILMESRIAQVTGLPAPYVKVTTIMRKMDIDLNGARRTVAELRVALGRNAIETSRRNGYRLLDCTGGRNSRDPIDELVDGLKDMLAIAQRLQQSIKEGLINAAD